MRSTHDNSLLGLQEEIDALEDEFEIPELEFHPIESERVLLARLARGGPVDKYEELP